MAASLCGFSLTSHSADRLAESAQTLRKIHEWTGGGFLLTVGIGIACKIEGVVFSFFSGGYLTTLGAVVVSSPYFLGLGVALIGTSTLSWVAMKVCQCVEQEVRARLATG